MQYITTKFNSSNIVQKTSILEKQKLLEKELLGDKCKAKGSITKILNRGYSSDGCEQIQKIRLKDGNKEYVVAWLQDLNKKGCEKGWHGFTGQKIPKVGDELYVIAQWRTANILKIGSVAYNHYGESPDCTVMFGNDPREEMYLWADKCRVSGKIDTIQTVSSDVCGTNLKIGIDTGVGNIVINGREYIHQGGDVALCLSPGFGWFSTLQKVGDEIFLVVNKEDNTILKSGRDNYVAASGEPLCMYEDSIDTQILTGSTIHSRFGTVGDLKLALSSGIPYSQIEIAQASTVAPSAEPVTAETAKQPSTGVLVTQELPTSLQVKQQFSGIYIVGIITVLVVVFILIFKPKRKKRA